MLCLAQIGRAGHQYFSPVSAEIQTLEKTKSECLVAGKIVHTFLLEEQKTIEILRIECSAKLPNPLLELLATKMNCHNSLPLDTRIFARKGTTGIFSSGQ